MGIEVQVTIWGYDNAGAYGDMMFVKAQIYNKGGNEIEDLITLEVGQAIARIDNHIVRVQTHYPLEIPGNHCRERIIAQSHARYYRPVKEVQQAIRRRGERWTEPMSAEQPAYKDGRQRVPESQTEQVNLENPYYDML